MKHDWEKKFKQTSSHSMLSFKWTTALNVKCKKASNFVFKKLVSPILSVIFLFFASLQHQTHYPRLSLVSRISNSIIFSLTYKLSVSHYLLTSVSCLIYWLFYSALWHSFSHINWIWKFTFLVALKNKMFICLCFMTHIPEENFWTWL